MIMDPSGSGINVVAQERMKDVLAGEQGTWHAGSHTYQRILKGSGDEYPLNPLADFTNGDLDAFYGSGTEALLTVTQTIWCGTKIVAMMELPRLVIMISRNYLNI